MPELSHTVIFEDHLGRVGKTYRGIQKCFDPGSAPHKNCNLALVRNEDSIDLWWLHGPDCVKELVRFYQEQESWALGKDGSLDLYVCNAPVRMRHLTVQV